MKSKAEMKRVVALHKAGNTAQEISRQVSYSESGVRCLLKRRGLKPHAKNTHTRIVVSDGVLRCSKCGAEKRESEFYSGLSFCKGCFKINRAKLNNSSIERFLSARFNGLKRHAVTKGAAFALTVVDLIEIYHRQAGLCFYTDTPMRCVLGEEKRHDTLSVDRLKPEDGYTKSNIVLCTLRANRIKTDLPLAEIEKYLPLFWQRIQQRLAA